MKSTAINPLSAKIAITVIAVGTLISIAFVSIQDDTIVAKKKVEQPLKGVDVAYTSYRINAAKASVNVYSTGSKINIPASAFVDSKGKPITGFVDVKYREFHDPADFFVSGIPMTYDSAGVNYQFESAGMLEILASQDGVPVFVNPDKKITVEMASEQMEDKYNIYQFDSVAGNWKFIYKDTAKGLEAPQPLIKAPTELVSGTPVPVTRKMLDAEKEPDLVKPVLMDEKNYQFKVDADLAEFPEIAVYRDVEFEVKEGTPDFNKNFTNAQWSDIKLEKNDGGSFVMTLVKERESHTFKVNPVFDMASFETAFETYSSLLTERRNKEELEQNAADSVHLLRGRWRSFKQLFAKDHSILEKACIATINTIQRVFVISGFGIWNSDCPACLPKGENFAANYVDSATGKKLEIKTLYLVEKGRNAMFAITSYSRLYYDPGKENILWAVTSDNKLAIFKNERFKELKKEDDQCTIRMTIVDKHIIREADVKKSLQF